MSRTLRLILAMPFYYIGAKSITLANKISGNYLTWSGKQGKSNG